MTWLTTWSSSPLLKGCVSNALMGAPIRWHRKHQCLKHAVWAPSSSPSIQGHLFHYTLAWLLLPLLCWWHPDILIISSFDNQVKACLTGCLANTLRLNICLFKGRNKTETCPSLPYYCHARARALQFVKMSTKDPIVLILIKVLLCTGLIGQQSYSIIS